MLSYFSPEARSGGAPMDLRMLDNSFPLKLGREMGLPPNLPLPYNLYTAAGMPQSPLFSYPIHHPGAQHQVPGGPGDRHSPFSIERILTARQQQTPNSSSGPASSPGANCSRDTGQS